MEFLQRRGKHGDLKKSYTNCLIFYMKTDTDVLWMRLCQAILCVCCGPGLRAGVSVSLLFYLCQSCASWSKLLPDTLSAATGKTFPWRPLVTAQQWKAK